MEVFMNGAVWDIEQGLVLKLNADKVVTHAVRGYDVLTSAEINKIYGEPAVFSNLCWPGTSRQMEREKGAHWVIRGHMEASLVAVICHMTDKF